MFTAYAAGCTSFDFSSCTTIIGANGYLNAILSTILTLGWIVAAIFLAYGAIQYITSAGDTKKATEAKTTLTNALIGIVILLLIGSILSMVSTIFGSRAITLPTAPTVN